MNKGSDKGDKVKIISNISGHIFKIGQIVTVMKIGDFMGDIIAYMVEDENGVQDIVYIQEITP